MRVPLTADTPSTIATPIATFTAAIRRWYGVSPSVAVRKNGISASGFVSARSATDPYMI
jgi:hypothetical protein